MALRASRLLAEAASAALLHRPLPAALGSRLLLGLRSQLGGVAAGLLWSKATALIKGELPLHGIR